MWCAVLMSLIEKAEYKYGKFGKPLVYAGFLFILLAWLGLIFALAHFTPPIDRSGENKGMSSLHIVGPKGIRVFP